MMGGFMTNNGDVDLKRVQVLVTELGKMEDTIFSERKQTEERRSQGAKRRRLENDRRARETKMFNPNGPNFGDMTAAPVHNPSAGMSNADIVANRAEIRLANINAAAALKAELSGNPIPEPAAATEEMQSKGTKRKIEEDEEGEEQQEDEEDYQDEDNDDDDETMESETPLSEADAEAQGIAILKRVQVEKKEKEDAARQREPDDEVR
jgi:5'-3' exoribonuclease 2